jgi:hypothetical protein
MNAAQAVLLGQRSSPHESASIAVQAVLFSFFGICHHGITVECLHLELDWQHHDPHKSKHLAGWESQALSVARAGRRTN